MFHLISYKEGCHIVLISKIYPYFEVLLYVLENIPYIPWSADFDDLQVFSLATQNKQALSVCLSVLQIRFFTDKFTGPLVIHCHVLNHEDVGMMMVVDVVSEGL